MRGVQMIRMLAEQPVAIGDQFLQGSLLRLGTLLLCDICSDSRQQLAVNMFDEQSRRCLLSCRTLPHHDRLVRRDRIAGSMVFQYEGVSAFRVDTLV